MLTETTIPTPMTMLSNVSVARPGRLSISRRLNFQSTMTVCPVGLVVEDVPGNALSSGRVGRRLIP
jgi:hypothetical protein